MKTSIKSLFIALALLFGVRQAAAQTQNLFEASSGYGKIFEFTTNGVRSVFAGNLQNPHGLAFDSAGDLFVAETSTGNILEFTNNGSMLSSNYLTFATGFADPDGLAFNSAGNLFAGDDRDDHIYEYATNDVESTFFREYVDNANCRIIPCDTLWKSSIEMCAWFAIHYILRASFV